MAYGISIDNDLLASHGGICQITWRDESGKERLSPVEVTCAVAIAGLLPQASTPQ
jgi:hypothetical protein